MKSGGTGVSSFATNKRHAQVSFSVVAVLFLLFLTPEDCSAQSRNMFLRHAGENVSSPMNVDAHLSWVAVSPLPRFFESQQLMDASALNLAARSLFVTDRREYLGVGNVQADGMLAAPFPRYAFFQNESDRAAFDKKAKVYSNIQQMSGWYTSPDQGHPICSSKPEAVSGASANGSSREFHLNPTGRYNNCLWPIKLGESSTVSHFILDTYYRLSNSAVSQGVEFSSNHHVGEQWYKFSVQCSYNKGIFSIWDTAAKHWHPTNIPCDRPKADSWDHLVVETEISDGKAVFLSLTLNGVQHSIKQSFNPLRKPSSNSYGVHFQMNGDVAGHAYSAVLDKMNFTLW